MRRILYVLLSTILLISIMTGFTVPDNCNAGSSVADTVYHIGDIVEADVQFGNIQNGLICGYNYTIYYNSEYLDLVYDDNDSIDYKHISNGCIIPPTVVLNKAKSGIINAAMYSSSEIKAEISGTPVSFLKIYFKVKKDTDDPGISGECTSLSIIRNESQIDLLSPVMNLCDIYSNCSVTLFVKYVPETKPTPISDIAPKGSDIGKIIYHVDDIFCVDVKYGNIPDGNVSAFNYILYYDPDYVEPVISPETGEAVYEDLTKTNDTVITINPRNSGMLKIGLFCTDGIDLDTSGTPLPVINVKFKVKKNASDLGIEGVCSSLSIIRSNKVVKIFTINSDLTDTYSDFSILHSEKTDEIPVEPTIPTVIMGDMDKDGVITSSDALLILRMSIGLDLELTDNLELADVDNDGIITAGDALEVLRFSVGLPSIIQCL